MNTKETQKQLIIEIMKGDEELGLYEDKKLCECGKQAKIKGSCKLCYNRNFRTKRKAEKSIILNYDKDYVFGKPYYKISRHFNDVIGELQLNVKTKKYEFVPFGLSITAKEIENISLFMSEKNRKFIG